MASTDIAKTRRMHTDERPSTAGNSSTCYSSFGVLGMVFYEKQDLRRDAQEELGYAKVPDASGVSPLGVYP